MLINAVLAMLSEYFLLSTLCLFWNKKEIDKRIHWTLLILERSGFPIRACFKTKKYVCWTRAHYFNHRCIMDSAFMFVRLPNPTIRILQPEAMPATNYVCPTAVSTFHSHSALLWLEIMVVSLVGLHEKLLTGIAEIVVAAQSNQRMGWICAFIWRILFWNS